MVTALVSLGLLGSTPMGEPDRKQLSAPAPSTAACPDMPRVAAVPRFKPRIRPLTAEPPARHIATVYATRNGCPVILVLDEGRPQWRVAPGASR